MIFYNGVRMIPCKKLIFIEQTAVKERQGGGCPVSWCKTKEIPVRGFSYDRLPFRISKSGELGEPEER